MKTVEVTDKTGWNDFVANSEFGDILQTWEWGEIKKDELWQPIRLRVEDESMVIGQGLVLSRRLPMGFRLYYMPRGPVLDYRSEKADVIVKALLDFVADRAKHENGLMVKIGPSVRVDQVPDLLNKLQAIGLKLCNNTIQMKYSRIIDLRPSEADILQSFDKDTRNLVRRAAKEQVVVDHFGSVKEVKELRAFHNMYLSTAERGSFSSRPWSQMVKLWELMAPQGMAHVYTASFDGDPLASSLVLKSGDTAYQLWSGSRRDVGKKYATYALQWTIMQDMKSRGVTTYDMWGLAPTDEPNSHPWSGPTMFKKGFGGERIEFIGDFDYPLSPAYRLFSLINTIRQKLLAK